MTIIRPIRAPDREPVLELLVSTGAFLPHELEVALELMDSVLTQPAQQDYHAVVVEQKGAPVAYACFGRNPMTRFTYDLYWLATHRDAMRQGHGRALVHFVEQEVQGRGGRLVVIETSSKESYEGSRRFYDRAGYTLGGVIPGFYDTGDDRVIYFKTLANPDRAP